MSEELIQRNLVEAPEKMGDWNFYNIGATTLKALKGAKIIPDRDYEEYEGKKPDALIIKKPIVIAAIEYKTPAQLRTEKQVEKAIVQELGTAQALQARVYIVTDGKKSFWVNPATGNEIMQEDGSKITLNFDKNSTDCITLINKIRSSISATNDKLKAAAAVDPLPLAEKVWQDLWAVSGATPENCLYTFVEVFIFKYLSDLGVLKGMYSFYDLLGRYSGNNENEVLEYYASTVRVKIKELFPGNPKDKTTIINGTIFVSKDDKAVSGYATVFHRILKRFNDFGTLENIDYDFKSKLFETFLKESISKKNWGQYFTPLKVVRAIVNMVDITPGMEICDPACGVGKFLLEPILHNLDRLYKIGKDDEGQDTLEPQVILSGFDKGFDKDEQKTIILAKANMLIYMSGMIKEHPDITKEFAQLFNDTFLLQTNSILGTLARPVVDKYDLILTNPPYVMSGSSNLKEEIAKDDTLKKYYEISAMGIEGLFMEWIVRALKPGGKAFIVVPDGVMNRSNDKKLRDFILEKCCIDAVISLPLNTFFTTNKKTYILALTKKVPANVGGVSTLERQTTPVFTYLCSEIGETRDVYRFDIDQNDLEYASDLFNMFKGAKSRFKTEESKTAMSLSDFLAMLGDISNSILEYQEPLAELQKKNKSEQQYKTVNLSNSDYFEVITRNIGKNLTILSSLDTHNVDDIPVYTAGQYPVAYIREIEGKKPIISTNNNPVLSFATNGDGSAGRNFVLHQTPFYINADRLAIRPARADILSAYIMMALRDMKEEYGFNHAHKANATNISPVVVSIPVDTNGEFDVVAQEHSCKIASCYEELLQTVAEEKNHIKDITLVVPTDDYKTIYVPLDNLFVYVKGKAKYTKKYGEIHKGIYPVYSASSATPLTHIDTYDYDGIYLTWSTNGFAGTILVLDGKFSINGDRGILLPKDGREDLDYDYMKYVLEPQFRELAKGRKGDNGEDEFTKLYPSMLANVMVPVPVDAEGNISLALQKEIATEYLAIQHYQQEAISLLELIIRQKVSL